MCGKHMLCLQLMFLCTHTTNYTVQRRAAWVCMHAGVSKAMEGMKVGETREVQLTLPDDFEPAGLRGVPVTCQVGISELFEYELAEVRSPLGHSVTPSCFWLLSPPLWCLCTLVFILYLKPHKLDEGGWCPCRWDVALGHPYCSCTWSHDQACKSSILQDVGTSPDLHVSYAPNSPASFDVTDWVWAKCLCCSE